MSSIFSALSFPFQIIEEGMQNNTYNKKSFQSLDVDMKDSKKKKQVKDDWINLSKTEDGETEICEDVNEEKVEEEFDIQKIGNSSKLYNQLSKAIAGNASDAIIRDIIFSQPLFKSKGNSSRKNPSIGSLVASWTYKSLSRRANSTGKTDLDKFWIELTPQINENTFSKGNYDDVPPMLKQLIIFGKIPPQ